MDFESIIKNLKAPILIVYHTDTDGVCSGLISSVGVGRVTGIEPRAIPSVPGSVNVNSKLIRHIEKYNPKTIIFVDLAVDQEPEKVEELAENKDIIIMDHHPINKDLNQNKNIVHINPKREDDKRLYPASKLCFDKFSEITDVNDLDWVAAVGVIADSGAKEWKKFLLDVNKKYRYYPYPKFESEFDMPLGEIGKWINSARLVEGRGGLKRAFRALSLCRGPEDFLKTKNKYAKELKECNEKTKRVIEQLVEEFDEKAENIDDTYFYFIKNDEFSFLKSTVATILSHKHLSKTIFVFSNPKDSGFVFFSCRRSDGKVDLRKVIQHVTKIFKKSSGGGHKEASAGSVLKKDFEEFKKEVAEFISQQS